MQATDPYNHGLTTAGAPSRDELLGRLSEIRAGVGKEEFTRIEGLLADTDRSSDSLRDALSTRFMEEFRKTKGRTCFGLLYELNCHHLLIQVASRLRRYSSKVDPRDVLQEVFFNVLDFARKGVSLLVKSIRVGYEAAWYGLGKRIVLWQNFQ